MTDGGVTDRGVLAGLRVIDLSPTRVGAQISQLFADFGAEVIWVEPPGGAALRDRPAFPFWARGKQSVVLDLRTEEGRAAVRSLASTADVLIETFRPGVLDAKGLGYDDLAAINPRLVYTSVTGFGRQGPDVDLQGYEGIVAARLGIYQVFNRLTREARPDYVSVPWCSFAASQIGLHATLVALFERETSGLGQHVETNLAQAFSALDTWGWFEHLVSMKWPDAYTRVANYDADLVPTSPFPYMLLIALTKDGHWLQFAQVAPHLFLALMKVLGLEWMLTDPEWKGIPIFEDAERRAKLWTMMLEAANQKTLAEWQAIFDSDPNVFAEQFRAGPAVLDHPQLVHDGMVVTIDDPERGPVRQPGPLVAMAPTPAEPGVAPLLGSVTPASISPDSPTTGEFSPLSGAKQPVNAGQPVKAKQLPLAGVTILEFAVQFAAPHGPTLLTDLGARVIKVESHAGDPIRNMVPFPEISGAKAMAGKDCITIDLATPEGLAIVHQLVPHVDVVMEGFRAGVADRMGLGYETLRALNPDLIYLSSPGYGVGGTHGRRPAYAPSIGAAAGVTRANVGDLVAERPDLSLDEIRYGSYLLTVGGLSQNAQADGFAALGVASAITLGVLARTRGAGGQRLITTMLNTNAHAMSAHVVVPPASAGEPRPGDDMRGLSALYRMYEAADGWVFLAVVTEREWMAFAETMTPQVDLRADVRFVSPTHRKTNDDALAVVLADAFQARRATEWEHELRAADVACVVVTTDSIEATLLRDDYGRAAGYIADVVHPTFDEHPRMAPLVRFSRSGTEVHPGALAGQHTNAILTELGYNEAAIADLRTRNVVA